MSGMRSTEEELGRSTSKVAVLLANNDAKCYSIMIDSCQAQEKRLLHSESSYPDHTSYRLGKAATYHSLGKAGTSHSLGKAGTSHSLGKAGTSHSLGKAGTSHGLSKAGTSGQCFLQLKKYPKDGKKAGVECRRREEQAISLTETDIDKFFQWQWNRLCELSNEEASFFPMDSNNNGQQLVQAPQAVEALYFHLKAKKAGSVYWADQFLLLVGRNLDIISKDPDFLCLDFAAVCKILNSDYLDVRREKEVFNAGYRWIRADFDYRLQHANEVLSSPRYAFMSPEEIVRCVFSHRQLTELILNIPEYPQAVLRGIIGKYLVDIGMKSNYSEFEVRNRITMGDSCTPLSDHNGHNGPMSKGTILNPSTDNKRKPSQNGSTNIFSCISVQGHK